MTTFATRFKYHKQKENNPIYKCKLTSEEVVKRSKYQTERRKVFGVSFTEPTKSKSCQEGIEPHIISHEIVKEAVPSKNGRAKLSIRSYISFGQDRVKLFQQVTL